MLKIIFLFLAAFNFLVVGYDEKSKSNQVKGHFRYLKHAKDYLDGFKTGSRLIAEIDSQRNVNRDPHKIAGKNQKPENGFNKYWGGWGDINRLMDLGEEYLSKMRQNLFKGILHSIALPKHHAVP